MLNNISSFILILILFITIFIINYIYLTYIKKDTALNENINKTELMNNTMGTILLVFGGLKLFDLQKFSNIFAKYNLISKQIPYYSYFYTFIEIILAIGLFSR